MKYFAQDVAGNASAIQTQLVKIDLTPPTNSLSLTNVGGGLYPTTGPLANGAAVYYRGAAAGSFTVGRCRRRRAVRSGRERHERPNRQHGRLVARHVSGHDAGRRPVRLRAVQLERRRRSTPLRDGHRT